MSNYDELTPVQRRNKLAYEVKKRKIESQYGGKIRIISTLDEILSEDTPMAIPIQDLDTNGKQLYIPCAEVVEDERTGEKYLAHEYGTMPVASDTIDVIEVLEYTLDELKAKDKAAKAKSRLAKKQNAFTVPEGYKLVKIEEEAPVEQEAESEAYTVDSLGTLGAPKPKAEQAILAEAEPKVEAKSESAGDNADIKEALRIMATQLSTLLGKLE